MGISSHRACAEKPATHTFSKGHPFGCRSLLRCCIAFLTDSHRFRKPAPLLSMPLCRGLGFQVTPSPRSVQCTLTGGNAQWSISSRTVLNFDLFSGILFLDIGSVRQRNFTSDFEIKVLCDIFLLLSAITWCFSSLLSTRAYAQRFARFL